MDIKLSNEPKIGHVNIGCCTVYREKEWIYKYALIVDIGASFIHTVLAVIWIIVSGLSLWANIVIASTALSILMLGIVSIELLISYEHHRESGILSNKAMQYMSNKECVSNIIYISAIVVPVMIVIQLLSKNGWTSSIYVFVTAVIFMFIYLIWALIHAHLLTSLRSTFGTTN